jgi:RHS repeat-associated protein
LALFLGAVVLIGAVAEPSVAAPKEPDNATQTDPDLPDAEGTDVEPVDVDRDQDQAGQAIDTAAESTDGSVDLPDSMLDGTDLSGLGGLDPSVLQDTDGDGVVQVPQPEFGDELIDPEVLAEPAADPELEGPTEPAPSSEDEVGEIIERAESLDLSDADVGEEITELRTEESQTFVAEDGSLRTELSSEPLFVENEAGELVEVDPTPQGDRDGRWRAEAARESVSFGATATDAALGSMGFELGQMFSWSLVEAAPVVGIPTGDLVRYESVLEDVDLELSATAIGAKETLVLNDVDAPVTYDFKLNLSGLEVRLTDPYGSVELVDPATDEVVGVIPSASAIDAGLGPDGEHPDPTPVAYELIVSGDDTVLRLKLDAVWLHDPSRQFPVRVDPSTVDLAASGDAYTNSGAPGTNASTYQWLKTGYADGNKHNYFVRWNIGLLANATIVQADYKSLNSYSWSCEGRPFQIYRVTADWNPSTVNWNNQPSFGGTAYADHNTVSYGRDGCPANWFHTNLQGLVQGWVDGTTPNYGVTGRVSSNDNYSDSYTYKEFGSLEAGNGGGQKLEIIWSPFRVAYEAGDLVMPSNNTSGSLKVKVTNKYWMTWNAGGANPFKLTYHIYYADGETLYAHDVRRVLLPHDVGPFESVWLTVPLNPHPAGDVVFKFDMLQDMDSGADKFFSGEGSHPDLFPLAVLLPIPNYPPYVEEVSPAGRVDKTDLTLKVVGKNPDAWPAGVALFYRFKICTDVAMTVGCEVRDWAQATSWKPSYLKWNKTYYWNVTVREGDGVAPRATSSPTPSIYLAPTVPQPKAESHFGTDPYSTTHGGVNPSIGNYVTSFTDLQVPAAGLPVDLTRTYNSMDTRIGAFGPGWSTAIDMKAVQEPDGKILVTSPDGRQERFAQQVGAGWAGFAWPGAPGSNNELSVVSMVSPEQHTYWRLIRPDKMSFTFTDARLTSVADASGHELTIEYPTSTSTQVSKVTNVASGRSLSFTWDDIGPASANVVTTAEVAPAPGAAPAPKWTYGYENGRLKTACAPQAAPACTSYSYFADSEHSSKKGKLRSVTRPEGTDTSTPSVRIDYSTDGRVSSLKNAVDKTWTFSDDDDAKEGTYHPVAGWSAGVRTNIPAETTITQDMNTDTDALPDNGVQAVVVDIAIYNTSGGGWLNVYPNGTAEPPGSSMAYLDGEARSTLHTVAVDQNGVIKLINHDAQVDISFEIVGWYGKAGQTGGSVFVPLPSARIFDTRPTDVDPLGSGDSAVLTVQISGRGGIPDEGVTGVVYNLEGFGPTANTLLTAFPTGSTRPDISTMSLYTPRTADNLGITKVGDGGKVSLYNRSGELDVSLTVVGYFADPALHEGLVFRPVTQRRLLDTRTPYTQWGTPWQEGMTRPISVAGMGGLPVRGIEAVVGDVQGFFPTQRNPMRTTPSGSTGDGVTYTAQTGLTVGNHLYAGLGDDGAFDLTSTAVSTDVVVDVVGYFAPLPRTTFVQDPRGHHVEYRYDELGRLVSRVDEDGYSKAYGYDPSGMLGLTLDSTGAATWFSYDDNGQLASQSIGQLNPNLSVPWSATTRYGYVDRDDNPALDGKLAWVSDARSSSATDTTYRTTYEYDETGQPTRVTGPAIGNGSGGGVERTYTTAATPAVGGQQTDKAPAGLIETSKDAAGLITRYRYDKKGDLRVLEYPSAETNGVRNRRDEFTYDPLGRAVTITQFSSATPAGVTTTRVYDDMGRVTQQTGPLVTGLITHPVDGKDHRTRVATEYDGNGNIDKTTMTDIVKNESRWVDYAYDTADRLGGTTDSSNRTTSRTYDDNGNIATATGVDGVTIDYDYNNRNLVTQASALDVVLDPADPPIASFLLAAYGYDAAGRRVSETDSNGGLVHNSWRADGRMDASIVSKVDVTNPDTGAPAGRQRSVILGAAQLDPAGNPLETFEASDVIYETEFDGTSFPPGFEGSGSGWQLVSGEMRSIKATANTRGGGADGSVVVVAGSSNPALPAFRAQVLGQSDTSSYLRVSASGTTLRLEHVIGTTGSVIQQATMSAPLAEGDRVEVMFAGPRIWVLVNGALLLNAHESRNSEAIGVGLAATAAGQEATSFRFDRYARTVNAFDNYGRTVASTFDPGGADLKTAWTLLPDGRPDLITRSKATGPTAAFTQQVDLVYDPVTGALDKSIEIVEGGATRPTDYTIDDRGLTTAVVSPGQRTYAMTYDEIGQLTKVTEPARNVERYQQTTVPQSPTMTFGYNGFGQRTASQDAAGKLTWDWLDSRGFPIYTVLPQYTAPGGTAQNRVLAATFDAVGHPRTVTDTAGQVTDFSYNSFGQLVERKDPAAGSDPRGRWQFEYDNAGRLIKQVNPLDAEVTNRWDDLGRLVGVEQKVTQPSGAIATFAGGATFGDAGALLRSRSPEGVVATGEYDLAGRMTSSFDADNNPTTFHYDELSRLDEVKGPDNRMVRTSYNLAGDKTEEKYYSPTGTELGKAKFKWNPDHQLIESQSPGGVAEGFATTFSYDAAGQLVSRTTPTSAAVGSVPAHSLTEQWGYDELGRTTKYRDGRQNETWQTYNSIGLPEDTIVPAAGSQTAEADRRWRNAYNSSGLPTTQTAPGGVSVSTTYDELGRPKQISGTGGAATAESRNYQYDRLGQVTRVSTSLGAQNFTYDERGLLRTATGGSGDSSFAYDGDGRLTAQVDSSGTTSFTYDNRGLPDTMTSSLSGQVSFDFDLSGRPTTVDFGGNTKRTFSYDAWGRVASDKLTTGTGSTPPVLYGTDYLYDLDGNITRKTTSGSGVPLAGQNDYKYDQASRIVEWSGPGRPAPEAYTWDDASNRTQAGAVSAVFDAQNRLTSTSSPDGQSTFGWNANGTMDEQTVQPAQRRVSLIVANPASLAQAESALRDHLVAAGAVVAVVDDGAAASAANVDVVVIAPTADANTLVDKYKLLGVPVVNLAASTWQASGMTSADATSASTSSAYVADATHPVAASKTGTVNIVSAPDTINRVTSANLGSGAVKVWTVSSSSTDTVAAAYESGSTTPGGAAPARRVVVGLSAAAVINLNANGWDLVDAAIAWADNNPLKAGTTSYDFDAFEQLRKITPPTGSATTYKYDPLGRRLDSPTGTLTYAGTDLRPSADGAHRYQPGALGVIGVDDLTSGGGQWAHADGHTDVVGTFTPGATSLAGSQTFSPWGQPMGATGTPSPLGYQSERQDLPGGLIGMGVREYNPDTATFISHDPITDPSVPNGYSYTSSNPLGATDPTGTCRLDGIRGGYGYIYANRNGCNVAQIARFNRLTGWCHNGGGPGFLTHCKDGGRGRYEINMSAYWWVMCGLLRGCPLPHPKPPTGGSSGGPPDDAAPGTTPGSGNDPSSGGGTGPGGGGHPGVGSDPDVLANPPPPGWSPLAQQVMAGGGAVPNYDGRFQVDHVTGEVVDTGNASIATTLVAPTSIQHSQAPTRVTPSMAISSVEAGVAGGGRDFGRQDLALSDVDLRVRGYLSDDCLMIMRCSGNEQIAQAMALRWASGNLYSDPAALAGGGLLADSLDWEVGPPGWPSNFDVFRVDIMRHDFDDEWWISEVKRYVGPRTVSKVNRQLSGYEALLTVMIGDKEVTVGRDAAFLSANEGTGVIGVFRGKPASALNSVDQDDYVVWSSQPGHIYFDNLERVRRLGKKDPYMEIVANEGYLMKEGGLQFNGYEYSTPDQPAGQECSGICRLGIPIPGIPVEVPIVVPAL